MIFRRRVGCGKEIEVPSDASGDGIRTVCSGVGGLVGSDGYGSVWLKRVAVAGMAGVDDGG